MHIFAHFWIHNDENAMQVEFCSSASFSALMPYFEAGFTTHWPDLQADYDGGGNLEGEEDDEV